MSSVQLHVASQVPAVVDLRATMHTLGRDREVELQSCGDACWTGEVELAHTPRLVSVRLTCSDGEQERVCFDAVHLPSSADSLVAVELVSRPGGVWGLLTETDASAPMSAQFAWGLGLTAVLGLLFLRRLRG